MQNSKIEWTDHTFNPWHGCQRVSPGCEHCYAETLNHRYGFDNWGPAKTTQRRGMSENYWRQPLRWNKAAEQAGQRARVFCASMADWLEDHPMLIEPRARLLLLIHDTPWLDWLLLTKRPEGWSDRLHEVVRLTHDGGDMIASHWLDGDAPANMWMGTSVEDQRRADERIPELLKVPARVRFLSCEPLLGPVDLWVPIVRADAQGTIVRPPLGTPLISWVIVGGESGHGARPMHPDWARSLQRQCEAAGVAFFMKQWGEWAPATAISEEDRVRGRQRIIDRTEPIDYSESNILYRVGKKAAGRLLDGREWSEFPNEVLT
jgi:protein gp37